MDSCDISSGVMAFFFNRLSSEITQMWPSMVILTSGVLVSVDIETPVNSSCCATRRCVLSSVMRVPELLSGRRTGICTVELLQVRSDVRSECGMDPQTLEMCEGLRVRWIAPGIVENRRQGVHLECLSACALVEEEPHLRHEADVGESECTAYQELPLRMQCPADPCEISAERQFLV